MFFAPYLIVFTAGLVIAVYAMLQGVATGPLTDRLTRNVRKSAPAVAAFSITFGAVGYLLTNHSSLNPWIVLGFSAAASALTIGISAPLLVKLTGRVSSLDPEIEGQIAQVVTTVSGSRQGEISYQRDGHAVRQPALNVINETFQPGREVVIDRVENGVAYVEDWESVERRL